MRHLALPPPGNWAQLMEMYEALLSLPLSPRHEVCPGPVQEVQKEKPESPFAVLKNLKS